MGTSSQEAKSTTIIASKIALVVAQQNRTHVDHLARSAVQTLTDSGITEERLRMMWAPSLFHVPLLAKSIAESRDFDGIIVLGVAIKDQTDRYYMELPEVYRALMDVMMNFGIPLSCGIVSVEKHADIKRVMDAQASTNSGTQAAQDLIMLLKA